MLRREGRRAVVAVKGEREPSRPNVALLRARVALRAIDYGGYGDRQVLHGVSIEVCTPARCSRSSVPTARANRRCSRCSAARSRRGAATSNCSAVRSIPTIAARSRAGRDRSRRKISVAFRFTVLEIVLMGRAPHLGPFHFETRHDLAIAHAALERFDLLALARRPIQELSGGERKRVFLARALAQEPKVALLDEPTAFLDLKHVAEIFARFRELCIERGMAVVATLHDLNAAALYADRVLLLKDGATAGYGTPAEVLTDENLRAFTRPRFTSAAIPRPAHSSSCPAHHRSTREMGLSNDRR